MFTLSLSDVVGFFILLQDSTKIGTACSYITVSVGTAMGDNLDVQSV